MSAAPDMDAALMAHSASYRLANTGITIDGGWTAY